MKYQRFWFKAKKSGRGWAPANWQGWLILVLYILAIIQIFFRVDQNSRSASDTLIDFLPIFFFATFVLVLICYFTREK